MSKLIEIISREVDQFGILPFSRFMELALYCPKFGYYEKEKDIGRNGDFYTSVSVGSLFGELLAFQFANWLSEHPESENGRRGNPQLVESGAHDGRLANDILSWLRLRRPELFQAVEYCIVEPSESRRVWQRKTLADFENKIRWVGRLSELSSLPPPSRIIFSNELLDAMPVRRFGWDAKNREWFEWGVAVDNSKFVWAKIRKPPLPRALSSLPAFPHESERRPPTRPGSLLEVLPDDYTVETSPAAENWWRNAASVLGRGRLLAIDYGLDADERFSPSRPRGTLRAFSRHQVVDDILARVGEQDITAHVDFAAIQETGEAAALKTEAFTSQTAFLTSILEKFMKEEESRWTSARARQFQTLTHPEHLGRPFRVLVQSRP